MSEILSAETFGDWGVWWAPGDGFNKAGLLIDSHEALRKRLAAAEAEVSRLREALDALAHWKVANNWDAVQMRTYARAALAPPVPQEHEASCDHCWHSTCCYCGAPPVSQEDPQ